MDRREFALGAGALLGAATATRAVAQTSEPEISQAARALWRRALVLDCNIAPPVNGQIPLPPASFEAVNRSGVNAVKVSIGGFNNPFDEVVAQIAYYQRVCETHADAFTQIRTVADIAAAKRQHKLGLIFSFEGVVMLEGKLDRFELFRNLGVRVMQLSYNLTSPFGAGVLAPSDSGLTDLGRQAVARMNALGIALDLSHANPATTSAAMEASTKPVLMTHGGCSAVHPHPRNKSDAQLRALAEKGGVFGIYDLMYLAPSPRQPTVEDYIAHMTHALDVCGEDHVGIGSDTAFRGFDTSPANLAAFAEQSRQRHAAGVAAPEEDRPTYTVGLNRPDRTLVITDALLKRGVPSRVVEKVLGANFARAFGEIW